MADARRNEAFATFIVRRFPRAQSILVVADGKGELARKLANKGKRVTVIEAKPRFEGRGHKRIAYREGWFTRDFTVTQDLVVAMHPDEATAEVVLAADKCGKPFAVVPCCFKGDEAHGIGSAKGWHNKLVSLYRAGVTEQWKLPMTGKNVVVYGRPR